jgi:septum formation protein
MVAVALAKARAVARQQASPAVVLGADTEVVLDGRYLGKPADIPDALRMLRALRGRTHEVVTGVALVEAPGGREETAAVVTRVTMTDATDEDLAAYVATGEPLDKAGAYGYQGGARRFVLALDGDVDTVIGLPLRLLEQLLAAAQL